MRCSQCRAAPVPSATQSAPPGQLPRSVEIILEDDLVDVCKPGDRISVSGIYRAAPRRAVGPDTGIMRAVVVANAVQASDSDHRAPQFTQMDLRNIKSLARMSSMGPMDILAHSLAPSIFG